MVVELRMSIDVFKVRLPLSKCYCLTSDFVDVFEVRLPLAVENETLFIFCIYENTPFPLQYGCYYLGVVCLLDCSANALEVFLLVAWLLMWPGWSGGGSGGGLVYLSSISGLDVSPGHSRLCIYSVYIAVLLVILEIRDQGRLVLVVWRCGSGGGWFV